MFLPILSSSCPRQERRDEWHRVQKVRGHILQSQMQKGMCTAMRIAPNLFRSCSLRGPKPPQPPPRGDTTQDALDTRALLAYAVALPALPTMRFAPWQLKRRVGPILQQLMEKHVAAHAVWRTSPSMSTAQSEVDAGRMLWLAATLLLRSPVGQSAAQVRQTPLEQKRRVISQATARVHLAEAEEWDRLLRDYVADLYFSAEMEALRAVHATGHVEQCTQQHIARASRKFNGWGDQRCSEATGWWRASTAEPRHGKGYRQTRLDASR